MQPQPMDVAVDAGLGLVCLLPILLIGLLGFVFWIWMLVDCLTKESSEGNDKIIWALVIFFLSGFGALLYFFIRRPQRKREQGE